MVPDDWQVTKLGKLFVNRRERGDASLPTFSVTLNDGLVLRDSLDRKTETNLLPEDHLLVRNGDIAYNMMRMWQGASGLAYVDALVSPAYVVLRATKEIDSIFASYFFKSARMIYLFWAYSYGLTSDRLRLYYPDFALIPAVIPPIHEQRRIGSILASWDRAIECVTQLVQNSEKRKRALMQQLLTGRERLAACDDTSWNLVPLRTLCEVRRGASPRPIDDPRWFAVNGRGWVRISDVTESGSERLESTDQYLSPQGVEKSVAVEPGELIMSICATIGVPKIVGIPVCIHDGFVVFREVSSELDLEFLYYLLEFKTLQLANSGQPGTQKNLNTTIVGNIQVPQLSRREQKSIVAILKAADDGIRLERNWLRQLRNEKAVLMQELLTGKRRVKVETSATAVAVNG
jgi:type I restriction enzyme S subunit